MKYKIGRILITEEEIAQRVSELAKEISNDYSGKSPLLICVLKGAIIFLSDLMRDMEIPVSCDFIGVSSYGSSTKSSGIVKITSDLSQSIEGNDVLIVEDIIDSGRTIGYLRRNLQTRHPATLKVCTLLDKIERREVDTKLDYVGFVIPNEFVIGYGLDHGGYYRSLPYIATLQEVTPG